MEIDSLMANVPDLDFVLVELSSRMRLRPFLRFQLVETGRSIPVALLNVGETSIELLGRVEGNRPEAGTIDKVEIGIPVQQADEFEIASGMRLACVPAPKPHLRSVEILTQTPERDEAALVGCLGATAVEKERTVDLGGTTVRLVRVARHHVDEEPGLAYPGWHRMGVKVASVSEAHKCMIEWGLRTLVEPYQVMPGLTESMMLLPSGLIVQPTEEHLWKMMPILALEWMRSKISGRPIMFKTKRIAD
jgi:hypothetical protein